MITNLKQEETKFELDINVYSNHNICIITITLIILHRS